MPWRLPLAQPIYTIFGANTGVGKTIISTLLVKSLAPNVSYIKPVSTGPLSDADYLHVDKFTGVVGKVLYQFDEPCSPHLAAGPEDSVILQKLAEELQNRTNHPTLIESAGGVHSPAPSGSSQLELYRPLRLPVILVADSNLGGISTTISSYESLRLHGFDVAAIIGFKANWGNMPYLASKLPDVPAIQIPPPPARLADAPEDAENMSVYYDLVAQSAALQALRKHLIDTHEARIARLEEMPTKALETFWYPFTQHSHLSPKTITTIDSAHEDDFAAYSSSDKSLRAVFDASASWWTQGLGHGNSELAIEAAYAGSRYGHVILPNAVNEPALGLAESLLQIAGKDWASRVYYSDNGATGIEVALKMALKASRVRYANDKEFLKLGIVGLTGSYHGDTIGAMDASDPNVYNDEVDWYQARGLFFDPPSLLMQQGKWVLSIPEQAGVKDETSFTFETLGEIFAMDGRLDSTVAAIYTKWITNRLQGAIDAGQKLGALIFEPILLGAGGMVFVDPLFQRLLVDIVRSSTELCPPAGTDEADAWTGLPVITDEVFTGLYRLSVPNAYDLLGIKPDISVNAKLLTGGAVPLATTMASEAIFRTFYRAEKKDALLHGHSYTAHPTGTSVARKSLRMLQDLHADDAPGAIAHRHDWAAERSDLFSVWQHDFVRRLSHHARLDGVLCLGSVLSLRLRTEEGGGGGGGGYSSMAAANVVERMRNRDGNLFGGSGSRSDGIMARPLGNVIYFMASQVTTRETADRVQTILQTVLDSSL